MPYTLPAQQVPQEVIDELAGHCDEPLFSPDELEEWADNIEAHNALAATAQPSPATDLFSGLSPHPCTNPTLDNPLFCLQT
jgi:hypothetical protein